MHFYPRNKYLYVQVQKEEKVEDTGSHFILPDDYKRKDGPLQIVKLLRASEGSSYVNDEDKLLVVPSHLIENLEMDGQVFSVVSESAVYGVMVKV